MNINARVGAAAGGGVKIPPSAMEVVRSLKEIVENSDDEIYATLKECNMDLNETAQRLLNQGIIIIIIILIIIAYRFSFFTNHALCGSMPYLLVCQSYVVSWYSLSHIHMSPTASHYQYAFYVQCRFSDGVIRSLLFLSVPDTLFTARLELSVSYRNLWKHLFWLYVATDGYFSLVSLCSLKL